MRHGKKLNHLGRKTGHRKALMANMASSLIIHKKITTTVAKAKALRGYVEPLITKSKEKTTHNYRTVFAYLKDKEAVSELFGVVSDKVLNRPGGYTRILKVGNRAGDNADMAMIELVDFNEFFTGFGDGKKAASKRTRRGRGKAADAGTTVTPKAEKVAPVTSTEAIEDVAVAEEIVAPVTEEVAVEEVAAPVVEDVVAEEPAVDETPVSETPSEIETPDAPAEEEKKD